MRSFLPLSVICLCSILAVAQASPSPGAAAPAASPQGEKPGAQPARAGKAPAANPQKAETKDVPENAAVVTIKGLCSTTAAKPAASKTAAGAAAPKPKPCETIVTRKQLERVIDTVRPNLPPQQRRSLAQSYAELLVISGAATKANTEKDPKVQEKLRLSKLQILASSYSQDIQKKESEVPEADITDYYRKNATQYQQAKLLRIYIPMIVPAEGKPADVAATKALAEKIQKRAAAGEDFDKLQKEAFTAANSKGTPPPVELGERRHATLPPKQEEAVFALKAGEVSPALDEASGFYIYKVISKEAVPLDRVHDEIKNLLAREHTREALEKVRNSAQMTFNDAYFGTPAPPPVGGELAPHAPAPPSAPVAHAPTASPAQTAPPPAAPEAPKHPDQSQNK